MKDALDAIDPTIATWTPYPARVRRQPAGDAAAVQDPGPHPRRHQPPRRLPPEIRHHPDGGREARRVPRRHRHQQRPPRTPRCTGRVHPFHDVQVRITGPAVDDVLRSYEERATLHGGAGARSRPGPVHPRAGSHLVQIARTYFKPATGSLDAVHASHPNGESTPVRTIDVGDRPGERLHLHRGPVLHSARRLRPGSCVRRRPRAVCGRS